MKMLPRLFLFIAIFSMLSSFAFASVAVWSGDGFDNLASNASNWAGNAVPLSGDDVIFDNTSTKDCTWDINETPFSFSINGGYEGCVSVISTLILSPGPLQLNPIFPFQGLSTITNTPSTGALDPNPFLIDGNMTGSAGINIGVPPLGGDSRPRNIGLDFFTATWINTLFVWIDRDQLPDGISNSFSWEVYTSFDNVDWTRLPALTSAAFIQLESRFEIYFPNITARYVKAVVSPLTPAAAASYPTFPNPDMIFVTELQAFLASHLATAGVTGRWEGTSTLGGGAGVLGLLLKQSASGAVTGTVVNWPIANGEFTNGVFTGSWTFDDGNSADFQLMLSADMNTLSGTLTHHSNGINATMPMALQRLSSIPYNTDTTPPAVNATSPFQNQTNVARQNLSIAVTWSKPVIGWDAKLIGNIGGVQRIITGNDLIDKNRNTYDPQTHIHTMYLQPNIVLDPLTSYTLVLDTGTSVDWHDPYGVPAWPDVNSAYQITFTTGSL